MAFTRETDVNQSLNSLNTMRKVGARLILALLVAPVVAFLAVVLGTTAPASAAATSATCSFSGGTLSITSLSASSSSSPVALVVDSSGNITVQACGGVGGAISGAPTVGTTMSISVDATGSTAAQWFKLDISAYTLPTSSLCLPKIMMANFATGSGFEESTPSSGSGTTVFGTDSSHNGVGFLDSVCSTPAQDLTMNSLVTNILVTANAGSSSVSANGQSPINSFVGGNFVVSSNAAAALSVTGSSASAANTLDLTAANTTGDTLFVDTIGGCAYLGTATASCPVTGGVTFSGIGTIKGSTHVASDFIADAASAYTFTGGGTAANTLDLTAASLVTTVIDGVGSGTFGISTQNSTFSGINVFISGPGETYSVTATAPGSISITCGSGCSSPSTAQVIDLHYQAVGVTATIGSTSSTAVFGTSSTSNTITFVGVTTLKGSSTATNTFVVNSIAHNDSLYGSTAGDTLSLAAMNTTDPLMVDLTSCSVAATCAITEGASTMYFQSVINTTGFTPVFVQGVNSLSGSASGNVVFKVGNPIPVVINGAGAGNTLNVASGSAGQSVLVVSSTGTSVSIEYGLPVLYGSAYYESIGGVATVDTSSLGSANVGFPSASPALALSHPNGVELTVVASGSGNNYNSFDASSPLLAASLTNEAISLTVLGNSASFVSPVINIDFEGFTIFNGPAGGSSYGVTFDAPAATSCVASTSSAGVCTFEFTSNLSSTASTFTVGATLQSINASLNFNSGTGNCVFSSANIDEFCLMTSAGSGSQLVEGKNFSNFSNVSPTLGGGVTIVLPGSSVPAVVLSFSLYGQGNVLDGSQFTSPSNFSFATPKLMVTTSAGSSFVFTGLTGFPISTIKGSTSGTSTFKLDPALAQTVTIVGQNSCTPASNCANVIDISTFLSGTTIDASSGLISTSSGKYLFSGVQTFVGSSLGGTTFLGESNGSFGLSFVGQGTSTPNVLSYANFANSSGIGVLFDLQHGVACLASLSACVAPNQDSFSGIQEFIGSTYSDVFDEAVAPFTLIGNGGNDTLNFQLLSITAGANVNLANGTVTIPTSSSTSVVSRIFGIQNVIDSSLGLDVVTGNALPSSVLSVGAGGNDYIAGSGGFIVLGSGSDTLDLSHLQTPSVNIDLSNPGAQLIGGAYFVLQAGIIDAVILPASAGNATNVVHGAATGTTTVTINGGNNVVEGGDGSLIVNANSAGTFGTNYEISGEGVTSILNGTSGTDYFVPASGTLAGVTIVPSSNGTEILDVQGSPNAVYVNISESATYQVPGGYVSPSGFSNSTTSPLPSLGPNTFNGGYGGSVTLDQTATNRIQDIVGSNNNDVLVGSHQVNEITAGLGDSLVVGMGGGDRLYGTGGNTTFETGPGNNAVFGGSGNNTIDYSDGSLCPVATPGTSCVYGPVQVNLQNKFASHNGYTVNGQAGTDQLSGISNIIGSSAICNQIPGVSTPCNVLIGGFKPGVLEMGYGPLPSNSGDNASLTATLLAELQSGFVNFCGLNAYVCFSATALIESAPNSATLMIGGTGPGTTFSSNSLGDVVVVNSINTSVSVASGGATIFATPGSGLGIFGSVPTPYNSGLPVNVYLPPGVTLAEGSGEITPSNDPTQIKVYLG